MKSIFVIIGLAFSLSCFGVQHIYTVKDSGSYVIFYDTTAHQKTYVVKNSMGINCTASYISVYTQSSRYLLADWTNLSVVNIAPTIDSACHLLQRICFRIDTGTALPLNGDSLTYLNGTGAWTAPRNIYNYSGTTTSDRAVTASIGLAFVKSVHGVKDTIKIGAQGDVFMNRKDQDGSVAIIKLDTGNAEGKSLIESYIQDADGSIYGTLIGKLTGVQLLYNAVNGNVAHGAWGSDGIKFGASFPSTNRWGKHWQTATGVDVMCESLIHSNHFGQLHVDTNYLAVNADSLYLNATFRYSGHGASNGYILQSDASGNATWQAPSGGGWSLTGNSGTDAAVNFIGTTDAADLNLKRNGYTAIKLTANDEGPTYGTVVQIFDSAGHAQFTAFSNNYGQRSVIMGDADGSGNGTQIRVADSVGRGTFHGDLFRFQSNAEVDGDLTINNGNQSLDYVFTSDANGLGAWKPVSQSGPTGSEPGFPYAGQFYFDTSLVKMKFWNGTVWAIITSTP